MSGAQSIHHPVVTRPRLMVAAGIVILLAAMAVSTTWWPADKPIPGQTVKFDATSWAEENYESKVVPAIEEDPVDVSTLVPLLEQDPDAAGATYGKRDGSSPYTFAVTATGTAGKPEGGLLPIEIDGLPKKVRVAVQIGPAINGTALRDATGLVTFNDFVNQVDYSNAAIALNNLMKANVLAELDAASLTGRQVTVVGATAPLNPQLITITAVRIEAGS